MLKKKVEYRLYVWLFSEFYGEWIDGGGLRRYATEVWLT